MPFTVLLQPAAEAAFKSLQKSDPIRYKKVGNSLYRLGQDPQHPGLKSKRFASLDGRFSASIWQSHVENNAPSAYRLFWHYGPENDELTVVAITPHP